MNAAWNSPERDVTPKAVVLNRRQWLKRVGLAVGAIGAGVGAWALLREGSDEDVLAGEIRQPGAGLYPAATEPRFASVDRPLTAEVAAARYCNFYEFSGGKQVWRHVQPLQVEPWTVEVTGLVARPQTFDLDSLERTFPLEERIYRHRCVEAWAMVVPWTGLPFAALARRVQPLPEARYVRFVTLHRPDEMPRQRSTSDPWPYTEGLTLAEATNELTFLALGMYGHPLRKQHGAPVRLVVPWKYGFKGAKSLVRIEFTAAQPATFWNTLAPHEYDFAANVEPAVPHPRWSQASERMLGSGERYPTQRYNGYGAWVASLYG